MYDSRFKTQLLALCSIFSCFDIKAPMCVVWNTSIIVSGKPCRASQISSLKKNYAFSITFILEAFQSDEMFNSSGNTQYDSFSQSEAAITW